MIQTLADALSERGYETLTPVQEAVTQPELAEADLLVSAQTGSGKTVGFGLAIAGTILGDDARFGPPAAPLALVIAPTRELAFQVNRELMWLYSKAGARMATCVGGMDMRDERRALERGAHIVVGTPGRLVDHIQRGSLDMTALRAVVLDEADEMLDLGFREDLEFMLGEAPEDRRTLMFSATVPPMIAKLAQQYQRDAVRVTTLSDKGQHADIAYQALRVAQHDVENAVINVLRYHEAENAIVFANTRAAVNRLTARFANRGFSVVSLSGELSQSERSHALQAMRDGRARVCVATDVAARGIDLPKLELVVHAELPTNAETLLHRSGRTGRAGRKGVSALIVPPKVVKKAERLLKFAKLQAEWTEAPGADEILERDEARLLSDPMWEEEATEAEAAFAKRLLAERSPEVIAAAYLRLHRSRHSAPEDLSDPNVRAPRPEREPRERAPFGPSRWFSLSVGRADRAEARWLLPLILRTTQIDKAAIGAIRVRESETFIEIAEGSAESFEAALGDQGVLEEGVAAKRLDEAPDLGRPEPRAARPAGRSGPRSGRDDRGPKPERPKGCDQGGRMDRGGRSFERAERGTTEEAKPTGGPARREAPAGRTKPVWSDRAKPERRGHDDKGGARKGSSRGKFGDRSEAPKRDRDAPRGKPGGGGFGKGAEKPRGKPTGKPKGKTPGAEGRSFAGKAAGKPAGKGGKPAGKGKPAASKSKASNPSARFTPPGQAPRARTGGKGGKAGAGGMQPPKRRKP
jgi:ATP-dependent RNA helicase DeaD